MDLKKRYLLDQTEHAASDPVDTPAKETDGGRFFSNLPKWKRIGIAIIVLSLIVSAVTIAVVFTNKKSSHGQLAVETECGLVEGGRDSLAGHSAFVFKGIPYSRPPIKDLRWKPPQQLKRDNGCWKGILHAKKFKEPCSQLDFGRSWKEVGGEDCLYLNVWTPTLDSSMKLPVMVWIHGGSLVFGSSSAPGSSPNAEFVSSMNIVAVSISYRVNAFGFLSLDILSKQSKSGTSGNYGFMDQILALRWVKNNIGRFGGDPNRVTLVGSSSGGTSIFGLLASRQANGLFQRAIAMSGSAVFNKTAKEASLDNIVFLQKSNCLKQTEKESLDCLYNLNKTQVLHSIPWFEYPYWAMADQTDLPTINHFDGALCVVDGDVVVTAPSQLSLYPTMPSKVDVMVGTTAQEIDFLPSQNFMNKTFDDLVKFITERLSPFSSKLPSRAINLYQKMLNSTAPQLLYTTIASDIRTTCPNDVLSANLSLAANLNVYRYVVSNRPSVPANYYYDYYSHYSAHTWDSCALFGFHGMPKNFVPGKRDISFKETIRREFLNFLKTGRPTVQDWKRYPSRTGIFGNEKVNVAKSYHEEGCKMWNEFHLLSYGWIN